MMTEPLGTVPETPVLRVTVVGISLRTVVPATMLMPATGIPLLIPFVPPAPPKVSVVPGGASAVVAAVTGAIGVAGIMKNVMAEPAARQPGRSR